MDLLVPPGAKKDIRVGFWHWATDADEEWGWMSLVPPPGNVARSPTFATAPDYRRHDARQFALMISARKSVEHPIVP